MVPWHERFLRLSYAKVFVASGHVIILLFRGQYVLQRWNFFLKLLFKELVDSWCKVTSFINF